MCINKGKSIRVQDKNVMFAKHDGELQIASIEF